MEVEEKDYEMRMEMMSRSMEREKWEDERIDIGEEIIENVERKVKG